MLVEYAEGFVDNLRESFPMLRVVRGDARALRRARLLDSGRAGAVVSGLPLRAMTSSDVMRIVAGAFHHLHAEGAFFQFTYGLRCPVDARILDRLDLVATRVGSTLANLPPATVYRLERRRRERQGMANHDQEARHES